jgi:hypothetical protein
MSVPLQGKGERLVGISRLRILNDDLTNFEQIVHGNWMRCASRILEGAPVVRGFIEPRKWCWLWRRAGADGKLK